MQVCERVRACVRACVRVGARTVCVFVCVYVCVCVCVCVRYEDCPVQPHLRIFVGAAAALKLIAEAQAPARPPSSAVLTGTHGYSRVLTGAHGTW